MTQPAQPEPRILDDRRAVTAVTLPLGPRRVWTMPFRLTVVLAALLLTGCGAETGIETHQAWIRPAAQGENGAIYFALHNHGSEPDQLTGASSEDAKAVEILQ